MSPEVTIIQPDTSEMAKLGGAFTMAANSVVVDDEESHAEAQMVLQDIKAARTKVEDLFREPKKMAFQTHRSFVALEKRLLDPLDRARSIVTKRLIDYETAERKRAEEEARRKAAELREREQEALLDEAAELEALGDQAGAEELLAAAEDATEITVRPETKTVKVAGVTTVERWHAEVVDILALVRFVAGNPDWAALIKPNEVALNQLARAQRDTMRIPGVVAKREQSKAVRA